jgi:hypothetical protein
MAVLVMLDHGLAFVMLAALLMAAGVPLAVAWTRLLPDEPPPFSVEPGSFPAIDEELPQEPRPRIRPDFVAVFLLAILTLAFLIRFPGFPTGRLLQWLNTIAALNAHWIVLAIRILVIAACLVAGIYAGLRRGPLRIPLAAAATLVLILWFLSPVLKGALLSSL